MGFAPSIRLLVLLSPCTRPPIGGVIHGGSQGSLVAIGGAWWLLARLFALSCLARSLSHLALAHLSVESFMVVHRGAWVVIGGGTVDLTWSTCLAWWPRVH